MSVYRGSRKHILDWVEQESFAQDLTMILRPTGATVSAVDRWKPEGYRAPEEAQLKHLGPELLPHAVDWDALSDWWLVHKRGANTPNWDLVSTCQFDGHQGLVLVEAKANVAELKSDPKKPPNATSSGSIENHEHIGKAIEEARSALDARVGGVGISRDSHYQLANRVAYSWKLASLGLPVVLVYLGFLGDEGIRDVGDPLQDHQHWQSVLRDHCRGILPDTFFDRWIECRKARMQMIVRSRPVLEQSPSR